MESLWQLLVEHYQWVFSGAGIALLGGIIAFFKKKTSGITQKQKSGSNSVNIQAGGNVEFTQKNG
ncbi:hypothetical protein ACVBKF_02305 [Shewanella sp. 0m-11]